VHYLGEVSFFFECLSIVGLLTFCLQFATLFQSFLHDIVVSEAHSVSVFSGSVWINIVTSIPLGTLYSLLNDGRCHFGLAFWCVGVWEGEIAGGWVVVS
jgi:hypothetical protein